MAPAPPIGHKPQLMPGKRPWTLSLALFALIVGLYWPLTGADFVYLDDTGYVVDNPLVKGGLTGGNIFRAFTESHLGMWIPVTWMSYMVDVSLFGIGPRGFHLTNILLHASGMALLLLILWNMTRRLWRSAFTAALVALHPMRVESVAWITERKDVLSIFFLLLALACYLGWVRSRKRRWYSALLLAFTLGLMSKPMLVTFPLLLLLLDFWPLGRTKGTPSMRACLPLLGEKLPLLALSLVFSAVTFVQQRGDIAWQIGVLPRIEHAFASPFIYLFQTFWPKGLVVRFFPETWGWADGTLIPAALGLTLLVILLISVAQTRPYLAVGGAWFLIALFPVSGIVPVGSQWIADRFTYLPHIGLAAAIAWLAAALVSGKGRSTRIWAAGIALAILLVIALLTNALIPAWRDTLTLFTRRIEVAPSMQVLPDCVFNNFEYYLEEQGELSGAGDIGAHGNLIEAERVFREMLRREANQITARYFLGFSLLGLGRNDEALKEFQETVRDGDSPPLRPKARAHAKLGVMMARSGRPADAIVHYRKALKMFPQDASLHFNLAIALGRGGKTDEAVGHYREAVDLDPAFIEAYMNLGELLVQLGRKEEAAHGFRKVAELFPGFAEAYLAEGRILEMQGRHGEAAARYRESLDLPARNPRTHAWVINILQAKGMDLLRE
jgi:Flp pilus assembly protein TadD